MVSVSSFVLSRPLACHGWWAAPGADGGCVGFAVRVRGEIRTSELARVEPRAPHVSSMRVRRGRIGRHRRYAIFPGTGGGSSV